MAIGQRIRFFRNRKGMTQKRGFATKREAVAWEHEVMLKSESKLDMSFASFFEIYEEDKKKRVKEKHMGVQKPCYPYQNSSIFRGA